VSARGRMIGTAVLTPVQQHASVRPERWAMLSLITAGAAVASPRQPRAAYLRQAARYCDQSRNQSIRVLGTDLQQATVSAEAGAQRLHASNKL